MNLTGEGERLPVSIGGLMAFALRAWAANAPLYAALALAAFALESVAEFVLPTAPIATPQGQFKLYVLQYTGLFVDAFVLAAVALGVAARAAGATPPVKAIAGGAVDRWLPVIAVSFLAQSVVILTTEFSGLVPPPEPRALVLIFAPLTWTLWAILGLAGPFVALGPRRAALAVLIGFGRAFTVSLNRANLLRLCGLAVLLVLPNVLQTLLQNALIAHHVARAIFWGNVPIDVLTIGPLSAIETAFALDFARRAGMLDDPAA